MFKVICFATVGYKALRFFFFHCAIENIRAKAFESEVMLLYGDVLLNEGMELRVGVLHRYRVCVGCYRLICFNVWYAAGCKDREGALVNNSAFLLSLRVCETLVFYF